MVKKDKNIQDCGCAFLIDENGVPTVACPTNEAQAIAFAALQRNPDVQIRVVASVVPSVIEDADIADSDTDDFDADELELEFDDFGDEEDDDVGHQ